MHEHNPAYPMFVKQQDHPQVYHQWILKWVVEKQSMQIWVVYGWFLAGIWVVENTAMGGL